MKALVTGGGGFLGKAIVHRLVERGWRVQTLQRGSYPELDDLGATTFRGDISDRDLVDRAVAGCDVVFHVAALVKMWGSYDEFHRVNVVGTENILAAMVSHSVPKLVYTSTPSVVHAGDSIEGGDETLPYPDKFESPYPQSKAAAEAMVLAANGADLATVALRPHLIWGPGDTNLVPQVIDRARSGKLRFVGGGSNLVDTVYIDNAVDAHLLASDRLGRGSQCAGKAYFISNGDPRPLRDIVNGILDAAGLDSVDKTISLGVALMAGRVLETVHNALSLGGEPMMTRFVAHNLATAHWYDISAARNDLGYEPRISIDEGFDHLRAWFVRHSPVI